MYKLLAGGINPCNKKKLLLKNKYISYLEERKEDPMKDYETKIEIGENLLKAIKVVLNATEKENGRNTIRRLHPGKEVQLAFGINLTKMHKDNIDNKKHERSVSMP